MQNSKGIVVIGTVISTAGMCLSASGGRWIVPPLVFLVGICITVLGMKLLHKSEEQKSKRRAERHSDDADKLKETQIVKSAYYDFKIKGLIK